MAEFAITGVPGNIYTRLNIEVFSTDPIYLIRWSLYVRAMAAIKAAGQDDPFSYFSIAGIHKWPSVIWPEGGVAADGTYCVHHRSTFLPWHRVYIILFEQAIVRRATELAQLAPIAVRNDYLLEASKIRLPFWDWGNPIALPAIMANAQIDIMIPEQDLVNTVLIANPLLSYDFPGVDRPLNLGGPRTTRFQANIIANMLQADGLRAQLYDALTLEAEYGPFSNNGQQGTSSLENSHDLVHDSVGDYLRTPIAAAFDPIFWLHHSSIDRFYAMWQVRNPDAIFQGNPNQPADTILTPLAPFTTQNQGAVWTSAMIQRSNIPNMAISTTYMLGYDYPETLAAWTAVQRTQAVNDTIVGLYAPPPQPPGGPPPAGPPPDAGQILGQEQFPQGVIPVLLGQGVPPDLPIFAGYRREWRLWIQVKRNLVVPNFNIYALLGNTSPAADSDWTTGSDVAGAFVISKSPITMCQNCRDTENNLLYGGIILTDPLLHHLPNEIKLGDQTQVVEWLQKHLHWRIQAHDGTEVELAEDLSEFEPGCHKLLIGLESYETAYAPVDADGRPTCDVSKILGVTWDKKDHTEVTSPMASRGGATRGRGEYSPSRVLPIGTEVVE